MTVTINWHLILGYVVFVIVIVVVENLVNNALGVTKRFEGLPRWKEATHEMLYGVEGILLYIWFLKPLFAYLGLRLE